MPVKRLKEALDQAGIKYVLVSHSPAYTAQEVAASAHVPGKEMAKTVIVRSSAELAMAVLPASRQIDFAKLAEGMKVKKVELASEEEFRGLCPDCELGAMPPFGHFYGLAVIVDQVLEQDEEIYFNAGTHRELMKMKYADFFKTVKPKVVAFSG
jgi:Ala-tRNA(Pro) deacylase